MNIFKHSSVQTPGLLRNNKRAFWYTFLAVSFLFVAVLPFGIDTVLAAEETTASVVLLEDYGGLGKDIETALSANNSSAALAAYIDLIVKLAFGFGSIGAVILIVWGGVEYITAQSFTSKTGGKDRLVRALGALAILFSSFIVFNQLNPELLKVRFEPLSPDIDVQSGLAELISGPKNTNTIKSPRDKSMEEQLERLKGRKSGGKFSKKSECVAAAGNTPSNQEATECFRIVVKDAVITATGNGDISAVINYEFYVNR